MKKSKILKVVIPVILFVVIAILIMFYVIIPASNYKSAETLMADKKYTEAIAVYTNLEDYKDSIDKITECKYLLACDLLTEKSYSKAIEAFKKIENYKDSTDKIKEANYLLANSLMADKNYASAISTFETIADYIDSADKIKECKYLCGTEYETQNKPIDALKLFSQNPDYKDSSDKIIKIEKNTIKSSKIGDTIYLGTYNNKIIEWEILVKEEDKILVISKDILDSVYYNSTNVYITWEECGLRRWLDWEFEEDAFTATEKALILKTELKNTDNPIYDIDGGANTTDKIFILGYEEVKQYLPEETSRIASGAGEDKWWIRTPAGTSSASFIKGFWQYGDNYVASYYPCYVSNDGKIYAGGTGCCVTDDCGVRPAMWLSTK